MRLLLALLFILSGRLAVAGEEEDRLLYDFGRTGKTTELTWRGVEGGLETVPDGSGRKALRLHYPVEEANQWPALVVPGGGLSENNFMLYERLTLEVFNPAEKNELLLFHAVGVDGGKYFFSLTPPPGWSIQNIPIDEILLNEPVKEIQLLQDRAMEPHEVYVGKLLLHGPLHSERIPAEEILEKVFRQLLAAPEPVVPAIVERRRLLTENYRQKLQQLRLVKTPSEQFLAAKAVEALIPEAERLAAFLVDVAALESNKGPVSIGFVDGLTRVYPECGLYRPLAEGSWALACNEAEAIQLCLLPAVELNGVVVSLTPLVHEADPMAILPASIAPVGFVNTIQPAYPVDYLGWTPDVVLTGLEFCQLPPYRWQPFWLEAAAAPDQRPGIYRGAVTVRADELPEPLRIPITVEVWNFRLPSKNSLPLAMTGIYEEGINAPLFVPGIGDEDVQLFKKFIRNECTQSELTAAAAELVAAVERYETFIASHRIPVDNIYRRRPPRPEKLAEWLNGSNTVLNLFCYEDPAQLGWFDAVMPTVERHGWQRRVYTYGFDEIHHSQFPAAFAAYRALKAKYPWLQTMTTAYDDSFGVESGLDDLVDIWVPLTTVYEQKQAEIVAARKRGKQIWTYVAMTPAPPSMNLLLETPAVGTRMLPGFWAYQSGIDGFLYYLLTNYHASVRSVNAAGVAVEGGEQPWPEPLRGGSYTNLNGRSYRNYNGDGMLVYPGERGPLASLRLKFFRDGLEDYEYLALLEQMLSSDSNLPTAWRQAAEKLLSRDDEFLKSTTEYNRDPAALFWRRAAIAALLEQAAAFR